MAGYNQEFRSWLIAVGFTLFSTTPGALVKPVTVTIRDGQNVTTITEASRICHVAVTSSEFTGQVFKANLAFIRHRLSLSRQGFSIKTYVLKRI